VSISVSDKKPIVGITCGDLNGVGPEVIIKTLSDSRIVEFCVPVVFGNNRVFNFYRKIFKDYTLNFTVVKDISKLNTKQLNILNCWEEEVALNPGELNETGGRYAVKSLLAASEALKTNSIDILVTAPIHKKNVYSDEFPYVGHTPFLQNYFGQKDVLMFMTAGKFRVGLVTEHIPIKEVSGNLTRMGILSKILLMNESLKRDFNVQRPKIAVLALNPHAGDDGMAGNEEEEIIKPAIKDGRQHNIIIEGPFAADGFFARSHQLRFDAVLAMYHDQGLIPFKSLAAEKGINFTAGLPFVRTSPDHGTALDIAGRGEADPSSFRAAIFDAIDIYRNRIFYDDIRKNPLKRRFVATGTDEKIEE
jgi:4-hydroxythreonine-4-phosphate dehydrogenase